MLIDLIDGGIISIDYDSEYEAGSCPTCSFGENYISEIDIILENHTISIRSSDGCDYPLSEGIMMKIMLSEYENINNTMTEGEFCDFLKIELEKHAYIEKYLIKGELL